MAFLETHATLIFSLFGIVILALSGYLAWLLLQIHKRNRAMADTRAALDATNQALHAQRIKSLEMISLAALDGDCDLSEACIRVKKLLEFYPGLEHEPELRAIQAMYEEIKGFAMHDDRRALSARARAEEDRQRFAIEDRYRELLLQSLAALHERVLGLQNSRYDIDLAQGP